MKLEYQVENFCGIATAKTGAHIAGWFNFIFNSLYISLQVSKLAKIKNLADLAFHRRNHHWTTYDNIYERDCRDKYGPDSALPNNTNLNGCIDTITKNIENMKSEIKYIESDIVPTFYWSTLVPFFVLILSIFWLTQLESKNARLVRALCWTLVTAVFIQLFIQMVFLIFVHVNLKNHINCGTDLASATAPFELNLTTLTLTCENMRGIPWQLWFIYVVYLLCNLYLMPLILHYTKERIQWLNHREDDLVSHASGIFFEDANPNQNTSTLTSDGESVVTTETALDRNKNDVKNRKSSFRIEDDPFGDNFRASLEDIRTGTRMTTPRTPNMSRYSSRNSHEAIKEHPDLEAVSASSFSNADVIDK